MDPQQPYQPSLVCVGGMLRVAQLPDLTVSTPAPSPSPSAEPAHVTPFKQLASPFTASAPFTAPTTPYSTTPPPATPHSSAIPSTPYSAPTAFHPLTPQPPHPVPTTTPPDLQPQPQFQLLTQKQVRELRRLCRKTANRAHFEGRLTQIRQVASIAAMATSTLHLFDPGNPTSGHALRAWVATHRASGADWRDERPLSSDAVAELRRWDLLLKAWARHYFDNADTRHPSYRPHDSLKPVRLEFEKLSLASPSPATPASAHKARNVYTPDFLRLASPVTPADALHHLATPSPAGAHATTVPAGSTPVTTPLNTAPGGPMAVPEEHPRSAWSKPPLTGLSRWVDSRKPMAEVSINRVGDKIKITVPPANAGRQAHDGRYAAVNDQENMIPADLRRGPGIHASTTAKSWRNALMQTPERVDDRVRTAAKTLFPGHDGRVLSDGGVGLRSTLDWGKLRGGETNEGEGMWQTRHDNV